MLNVTYQRVFNSFSMHPKVVSNFLAFIFVFLQLINIRTLAVVNNIYVEDFLMEK